MESPSLCQCIAGDNSWSVTINHCVSVHQQSSKRKPRAKHWTRAQRNPRRRERTQRLLTSLMCLSKDIVKRLSLPSGDKHSTHSPLPNSIVQGLQCDGAAHWTGGPEEWPGGAWRNTVFSKLYSEICAMTGFGLIKETGLDFFLSIIFYYYFDSNEAIRQTEQNGTINIKPVSSHLTQ